MTSRQIKIWNRACSERDATPLHDGDKALASLLQAHGFIMNGGVLHALEVMTRAQRVASIAGYRYFGLTGAAQVLEQSYAESDEAEEMANAAYLQEVPDDDTIVCAFRTKLLAHPDEFSPTPGAPHA